MANRNASEQRLNGNVDPIQRSDGRYLMGAASAAKIIGLSKADGEALTLEEVAALWVEQCRKGNKLAIALVTGLVAEAIERRYDKHFGVKRRTDYRQRLRDRVERFSKVDSSTTRR